MQFDLNTGVTKPQTFVASLDDMAVVGQAVQQCLGPLGITKHAGPFREIQVGGDHNTRSLIALGQQMEQQGSARLGEG